MDQGGRQFGAAFDEQMAHTDRSQRVQPSRQAVRPQQLHPLCLKLVEALERGVGPMEHDNGGLASRPGQHAGERQPRPPIEDHPPWGNRRGISETHGERGIVGEGGTDPHPHGVGAGAQGMHRRLAFRPREPGALARGAGDGPIDRNGQLERDKGGLMPVRRVEERCVPPDGLGLADPPIDSEPRGAEPFGAAGCLRVGVARGEDHA